MAKRDKEDKEKIVPPPPCHRPFSGGPREASETASHKEGKTPKDLEGIIEKVRARWEETLRKVEAEKEAMEAKFAEREGKERAEREKRKKRN